MPKATPRANAQGLPNDEPRFRISHLVSDPALRSALETAEDGLGAIPVLPSDECEAGSWRSAEDARSIFHHAFLETKVKSAQFELALAKHAVGLYELSGKELNALFNERMIALAQLRKSLVRLAGLPAMTYQQLEWKKRITLKPWRKDSVFSDAFARDEAYLKTKTTEARRPRASRL